MWRSLKLLADFLRTMGGWPVAVRALVLMGVIGLGGLVAGHAHADGLPAVQLSNAIPVVSLAGRSQFLIDRGGKLTVQEVARRREKSAAQLRPAGHRVELASGDAMWVRFAAIVPDHRALWRLDVDGRGLPVGRVGGRIQSKASSSMISLAFPNLRLTSHPLNQGILALGSVAFSPFQPEIGTGVAPGSPRRASEM